ncbi:MAG: sensor hybrid histidine kinase [Chromatiaceae bacterium]|nr:sensor hybrid histidine kinase [Chromatiaceae bacterium]
MTGKRNNPTRLAALQAENQELRRRLEEAEETLRAIREGEVDAVVVTGSRGTQIFSLSGAESVYRLIVETIQEATLTVAPEGLILWCNPQFANLLQSPAGQILGKPLQMLQMFVNPDQHPRIDALLEQIRDAPVRERVVFRAADGTPVPASVDANRLLQPEGTIICLVVSTLTELESATDIARRLQQGRAERERSEHA